MRAALLLFFVASAAFAQQDPFPLPPKDWPKPVDDQPVLPFLLIDRLEYRWQEGADALTWDAQGWFGGDYNKLWLKSEGERVRGEGTEEADLQALYARRISPYWHLQAGVRREFKPSPAQNYGVLAIQGLAPYWFETEASLFFRGGEVSGRLEAEYDQLLTQHLILQPRIETNFSGEADPGRGIGSGFNDVQLGLRLRYEIRREFAPYVGITWRRKLGGTADIARSRSEDVKEYGIVAGIRVWY